MGLYKAVQASSDLVESQGQVRTIFGDSAGAIEKFGDRGEDDGPV